MGRDISPIGNHNLNTENIKNLAEDLTSRLDINIEYGYWGFEEYFKMLGEQKNDDVIVLGEIIKNKRFKTFKLRDENYQLKQLHEKFGDDLFSNPEYWIQYYNDLPNEETILIEKKQLVFPTYLLEFNSDEEFQYLNINKEHYQNDIPYYSRWWSFCRFFTENHYESKEYLYNFNEFRKELMYYTTKLGGNQMFYLDDQSDVLEGVGQGSEYELSWDNFKKFVTEKTGSLLLDIPKFLTDIKYRKEFLTLNAYPLSMIDNFNDLK